MLILLIIISALLFPLLIIEVFQSLLMFKYSERLHSRYSRRRESEVSRESFELWFDAWKRKQKKILIFLFAAFTFSLIALIVYARV